MPGTRISVVVSDDRQIATIQIDDADTGKPFGHTTLDAASLEGFLRGLGDARAAMAEEVTPMLEPPVRLSQPSAHPAWYINRATESAAQGGSADVVLALRHPGLGWIPFLLDRERAQEIAAALVKYSE